MRFNYEAFFLMKKDGPKTATPIERKYGVYKGIGKALQEITEVEKFIGASEQNGRLVFAVTTTGGLRKEITIDPKNIPPREKIVTALNGYHKGSEKKERRIKPPHRSFEFHDLNMQ